MNIKKMLLALSCTLMLACGKTEETKTTETNGDTTYKVGITQIVTHPSLDLVREGFKKSFEEVLTVKNILLVFVLIGMITALWRASGTIAFIVYMGSKLILP